MNRNSSRLCNSLLLVVLLSSFILSCTSNHITHSNSKDVYTVLQGEDAWRVLKQCSRPSPSAEGIWEPTEEDVHEVEQRLDRLHGMKADDCCIIGARLMNPRGFHRQYAGILMDGKRLIYINGHSGASEVGAVITCDGGASFWGVLYDPESQRFFNLAFNGEA